MLVMTDYCQIEREVLMTMLMEQTEKIIKMISAGMYQGEDFSTCRETILAIQSEIQKREPLRSGEELSPFLNPDLTQTGPDAAS
jgi:hypothetical protein